MPRVVGFHLLLFFAPFIVYAFYLYFTNLDPRQRESWGRTPIYWLAVAGLVLTIGSFLVFSAFTGADTAGTYVPARFEDGRIVPGRIE